MDDIDVSRTQKKKHALKVTNFAKQLSRLSIKQISKLDFNEEIKEEIVKASKMKNGIAKNRHIKYISGLLRSIENIDEIISGLKIK